MAYGDVNGVQCFSGNNLKKVQDECNEWLASSHKDITQVEKITTSESMVILQNGFEPPKKDAKTIKNKKKNASLTPAPIIWNFTVTVHYTYDETLLEDDNNDGDLEDDDQVNTN